MGNQDHEERDNTVFETPDNGWSDDRHGFQWLVTHFDLQTTQATFNNHHQANRHLLLIIDGHSSHLSIVVHWILARPRYPSSLPTCTLNPLTTAIGCGFIPILMQARRLTFTENNIKSALTATAIHPFQCQQDLNILQHLSTLAKPQSTPTSTIRNE